MRSGIYLILPLEGHARDQVLAIQERYDPRSFRGWPPHATLAGSSGMGPLDGDTPIPELRSALFRELGERFRTVGWISIDRTISSVTMS